MFRVAGMKVIADDHRKQFKGIQNDKFNSSTMQSRRKHLEVSRPWMESLSPCEAQQVREFTQQLGAVHDSYFEDERHFIFASFLLAYSKCPRQMWHTDYPEADHALTVRPLSVLVSLEPSGGSIAIMDTATGMKYSLHAEVVDVVFLGARCCHAGESADKDAFKFHLYADVLRYVVQC